MVEGHTRQKKGCRYAVAAGLLLCLLLTLPVVGSPAVSLSDRESSAIGLILPLSGRYAEIGQRALDAAFLAAGLFDGEKETPLRFLIEDSRSEPATAGPAVERLAAAGAVAILGPLASQEALAAAAEAQRFRIPILTLTQQEGITGIGEYVFRNYPTAAMQIRSLVGYARTELGQRRFAILAPNDLYGREMARLFREEVRRRGGEIRQEQVYRTDQTDFSEAIVALGGRVSAPAAEGDLTRMAPGRVPDFDALFIPDTASRVALIAPQLVYHGLTGIRLLGTGGWNTPALLQTDPSHLQGAVFVDGFFRNSFRPEVNPFTEAFYLAYGREPAMLEALVYDAVSMAVRLLGEGRGRSREVFRNGLLQLEAYPGVTGMTSFSAFRDAEKEPFLLTVRDGQIIQIR